MPTRTRKRSDRFLEVLSAYERVLVVTHDTPDPDGIASGWGVCELVQQRLEKPTRFVGRGAILRAENRFMVDRLRPPLEMVTSVDIDHATAIVLVDCSPDAGNHLVDGQDVPPAAVIDHHQALPTKNRFGFEDVRPTMIASATIVAGYLREQQVAPSVELATAMLYAIHTEAQGQETAHSRQDRSALVWLHQFGDPSLLAEIENAPLSPEYFRDLVFAFQHAEIYGSAGFCMLPQAHTPEIIGEVADLLIRCTCIERVLCAAMAGNDLCVSVRTQLHGEDASRLVRKTLQGLGPAGGHHHRAGGKISNVVRHHDIAAVCADLRNRWLAACGIEHERPRRLVSRPGVDDVE